MQFPIYLAYIFFAQKNGYDVLAFDAVADELNSEQFIEKLVDEKPDVIFMECSTPSFEQDISNGLKLKEKGFKVFIFGTHLNFYSEIIEKYKNIDGFIKGEFEYIIKDICDNINDLNSVKGLSYWDNELDKAIINPRAENIENLDDLPCQTEYHLIKRNITYI